MFTESKINKYFIFDRHHSHCIGVERYFKKRWLWCWWADEKSQYQEIKDQLRKNTDRSLKHISKPPQIFTKEVNYLERWLFARYIPQRLRPSGCIWWRASVLGNTYVLQRWVSYNNSNDNINNKSSRNNSRTATIITAEQQQHQNICSNNK